MINQFQVPNNVLHTIKRIEYLWIFLFGFFIIQGCSSDDDTVALSNSKQITSFQFEASRNIALDIDVVAVIDQNNKTIIATVPFNTDVTALKATMIHSVEASVTPSHKLGQDFSNPITYIVTAQDETKQAYEVLVKIEEPSTEREYLIAFYNANPDNTLNWNVKDENMNSWEGVSLDNGSVVGLSLIDKNISTIPSSFGNLIKLTTINLNNNNIVDIPVEIGNLTQLTILNLSENNLINIPKEIGDLVNLNALNLYNNKLTSIPKELGKLTNLFNLYLKNNLLTSIPRELGNLTTLSILNLNNNDLINIPEEIGNLTNLKDLSLGYNTDLIGIPEEIGNLTELTKMNLYGSNLSSLPTEIGNLINLTSLSLGSNNLTSIPAEIGNLTKLGYLDLSDNNLTEIPKEVCDLETNYGTTIPKDDGVNCVR